MQNSQALYMSKKDSSLTSSIVKISVHTLVHSLILACQCTGRLLVYYTPAGGIKAQPLELCVGSGRYGRHGKLLQLYHAFQMSIWCCKVLHCFSLPLCFPVLCTLAPCPGFVLHVSHSFIPPFAPKPWPWAVVARHKPEGTAGADGAVIVFFSSFVRFSGSSLLQRTPTTGARVAEISGQQQVLQQRQQKEQSQLKQGLLQKRQQQEQQQGQQQVP